jgi:hypothetical protein
MCHADLDENGKPPKTLFNLLIRQSAGMQHASRAGQIAPRG